jgi:hypothetical protein
VAYEPVYERFEAVGPDGQRRAVGFKKAGFLALGDQPELYFFSLGGEEAVVAISGETLRRFQRGRRSLSREEKIDLAGLLLKRRIEAGFPLVSENLLIRDEELASLASELGLLS